MIVAAAFLPTPPLLHPQARGSAGNEQASALRSACARALARILGTSPAAVVVLGASSGTAVDGRQLAYRRGDAGELAGYGVPVLLGFDGPPTESGQRVPLAHTLGAWLLDEAGFTGWRRGLVAQAGSEQLQSVHTDDRRWAILVMGDGSARRTEKSPGWYDSAAVPFDDTVAAVLAGGNGGAFLDLDEAVGERVLASGLSAWRAAAELLAGPPMDAEMHYAQAPYGVFYAVASWIRP